MTGEYEQKILPVPEELYQQPLYAISAGDAKLGLTPYPLTLGEALKMSATLAEASEADIGRAAVREALESSGISYKFLPYRLLFPPSAFQAYLGMYGQFDTDATSPVPAEDVLVVKSPDNEAFSFIQRSSLWSAVIDGVSEAKLRLIQPGDVITVGGVQPCFRREVKTEVPGWRQKGFTQADIEIAALTDERVTPQELDTASIRQMVQALIRTGVPKEMIQIRLNNFMGILYPIIGPNIPFLEKERFGWECLDKMACAKVAINTDEYRQAQSQAKLTLTKWQRDERVTPTAALALQAIIENGEYDRTFLTKLFPEESSALLALESIAENLKNEFPAAAFSVDPLSVRGGTPGYDRTTMQADICTPTARFAEVAGGGAYQAAAKVSWKTLFAQDPPSNFYMVGFALGLLRIQTALRAI